MIYEMRTYDLKPRSLAEVEKRFGDAYEKRKTYSEMAVFWHTEIGPLNQIIHVWPYQDLEERGRIRAAAVKDKVWPPNIGEFIVRINRSTSGTTSAKNRMRRGSGPPGKKPNRKAAVTTGSWPRKTRSW